MRAHTSRTGLAAVALLVTAGMLTVLPAGPARATGGSSSPTFERSTDRVYSVDGDSAVTSKLKRTAVGKKALRGLEKAQLRIDGQVRTVRIKH